MECQLCCVMESKRLEFGIRSKICFVLICRNSEISFWETILSYVIIISILTFGTNQLGQGLS